MAQSTYYFAWAGSGETVFSGGHMREDELVFSFELKHEEGQFAELELEILNPRIGLLAPGRPLWAWLSWSDGSGVYPLFFGRLVGIPDDLFQDIIKIKLVARPIDYAAQRENVAESLRVLPYYDPIFIDDSKLDDPDTVLEGYSKLWHVDRYASYVSVSDIITGEDGYVTFTQAEAFYDKLSMKIAGAPLLVCEIECEVEWTQCDHTGIYEMKTVPNLGEPKKEEDVYGAGVNVSSGAKLGGGGVKIEETPENPQQAKKDEEQTTYTWTYKNISPGPHSDGDLMEESGSQTVPFYGGELIKQDKVVQYADKETGQGEEYSIKESYKYTKDYDPPRATPDTPVSGGGGGGTDPTTPPKPKEATIDDLKSATKEVGVEVEQDRAEAIYVAMAADVQPVLASLVEDRNNLVESLRMDARDLVSAEVISASDGAYFATDRGQQSVEYLLMIARAHLLAGSRVVEIEWECSFPKLVYSAMSCRMNAIIYDDRLPGGVAIGKVVGYAMTGDGDHGEFLGKVTINCSVGAGTFAIPEDMKTGTESAVINALTVTVEGTPVYADLGYVDVGYQHYAGRMISAATNDVSFSPLEFQAVGLQLPITEDQILVRHEYHDGMANGDVAATLEAAAKQLRDFKIDPIGQPITSVPAQAMEYARMEQQVNQVIAQVIADNPSWVEMEFKPTKNIPARAEYVADVSQLTLPMHIDLSAPSGP